MKTVIKIAWNELTILWRQKGFQWLLLLLFVFTGYAIYSGASNYQEVHTQRGELKDSLRHMFTHQNPKSPHSAGHYGHIVFKPYSLLQAIDQGVESYTGTTVRLEAHRQNEAVFSPASTQSSLIRFGEFSFSILLQVVIPLLIIFICYGSIVSDRKNGTLKILVSQGINMRQLIFAKVFAYHLFFTLYLVLIIGLFWGFINFCGDHVIPSVMTGRLLLFILLYSIYYLIIISLIMYFSARVISTSGLLTSALALWFVWTIILPKLTTSLGAVSYPLITKTEFKQEMKRLKENEIDVHSINDKMVSFVDSVLLVHGVENQDELPFRISGLLMHADEEARNKIHDRLFSNISDTIRLQNSVSSFSGIINPFIPVKKLSMALSSTDVYHHFHFIDEAENYRRMLMSRLNDEDKLKKSDYKDEKGRVSEDFWIQIQDFDYKPASLWWSLENSKVEITLLLLWLVTTLSIVYSRSAHIKIV